MSLTSKFKELYGSALKGPEKISNHKIATAVRDIEKKGYKKTGVYKTDSEQLYSAVDKAKTAGLSVSGVKIGSSTVLFKKQKDGLAKDMWKATKIAAKGLGEWADRVALDEKPAKRERKAKTKTKAVARKTKRAVKRRKTL
ncbi:MAG: hypothetical protein LLF94_11340 [Chlamydiales bacterium]|nr:hypothetical protein [Chlamydiales bacterium]